MKRLEDMTLQELWALFPITLRPHDDRWRQWAANEIDRLKALMTDVANIKIHHIGSTAVSGICAKPVVDLLVEADYADFEQIRHRLLQNGYLCMNQSDRRIDFNRGYTPTGYAERVFHLHLREFGDNDELYFRDWLNAHSDVAREYESLKLALWKTYEHDRDGYTNAKSQFVRHYTDIAKSAAGSK